MSDGNATKQKFIDTASRLFRRRGYHAVGLTEIIAESGAPKGSFYYHFPDGKEELAEHSVKQAEKAIGQIFNAAFASASSFEDGARRLAEKLADWFEKSDYEAGCPITPIIIEMTPASARLSAAIKSALDGWTSLLEQHAIRLGAGADARDRAERLIIALEGAWITARAARSSHPFLVAARMA